ncbi:fructosamine-3-kinase [Hylobates moloch]|uniref:fructosamine-3-kinase n=1 Tax=Hylobates moloch TaxID=81572 RepID=UPI002677124D|nr:fructosamine-3-kinase [Hylobates moloch]
MHAWASVGIPVSQVPFPGRPGISGPTLGRVSACHRSPHVSLSLRLAPGTPVRKPHVITGAAGPGLVCSVGQACDPRPGRGPDLRPPWGRDTGSLQGAQAPARPRRAARIPGSFPRIPGAGSVKPDERGERAGSPPEAAPPTARGHAPRGPAPPRSASADPGFRASRKSRAPHSMEQLLRAELRTATLRAFGSPGAYSISEGRAYDTDAGPVFVKVNRKTQARQMFEGEVASLEALRSTGLVRVPRPMKVIDLPGGGAAFVMEHLKMRSLSSQASKLGEQMADLHLYNQKLREKLKEEENTVGQGGEGAEPQYVNKFGFHKVTCCGFIPQVNEWQDDWPTFFARHRLQAQLDLIEKDYADREARELWSRLQVKIPDLFCGVEIVPALLHGDLWSGNVAEDDVGPIIYDPASFYGHSEFELAIALMFGGFPRSFFTAYHRKIPKAPGFDQRLLLYQLFNYLNHWNHFGRVYRSPSLGTMRRLLK